MLRRTARTFRPKMDGLETRIVPSATRPVAALAARNLAPSGTGKGTYHAPYDNRPADEPLKMSLDGAGRARGLGRVTMTGTLSMGGFVISGSQDIFGTITIANRRGTLNLKVSGSGGSATIPGSQFRLDATLEGGTGAYKNVQGTRTVNLSFGPNTLAGGSLNPLGGNFQIVVTPRSAGH